MKCIVLEIFPNDTHWLDAPPQPFLSVVMRRSTAARVSHPRSRKTLRRTSRSAVFAGGVLQPVHRALARQRRTILALGLEAVAEQRQHRIEA